VASAILERKYQRKYPSYFNSNLARSSSPDNRNSVGLGGDPPEVMAEGSGSFKAPRAVACRLREMTGQDSICFPRRLCDPIRTAPRGVAQGLLDIPSEYVSDGEGERASWPQLPSTTLRCDQQLPSHEVTTSSHR
jgi:hypothetical protein